MYERLASKKIPAIIGLSLSTLALSSCAGIYSESTDSTPRIHRPKRIKIKTYQQIQRENLRIHKQEVIEERKQRASRHRHHIMGNQITKEIDTSLKGFESTDDKISFLGFEVCKNVEREYSSEAPGWVGYQLSSKGRIVYERAYKAYEEVHAGSETVGSFDMVVHDNCPEKYHADQSERFEG